MKNRKPLSAKKPSRKNNIQTVMVIAICILALVCGSALFWYSDRQTNRIRQMLNESAYRNVENILTNLENAIRNEFITDEEELKLLASGCSKMDDISAYLQNLTYSSSEINGIYFGEENASEAIGKDGKVLELDQLEFKEHANGIVRSEAYMNQIGDFSYVVREPIKNEENLIGYLYAEYAMERFANLMPRDENIEGNNYSIMVADTMRYVYTPSGSLGGSHINFRRLQDYLQNSEETDSVLDSVEKALQKKEYYMKISTLKNIYDASNATDYVVFLWPIEDGEYYISGFARVSSLQAERIDVENTIQLLFLLVMGFSVVLLIFIGTFFGTSLRSAKKITAEQKKHNQELNEALQIAKVANESKSNFLSNMSHDIRTPMNAIIGFTTLQLQESKDEKALQYARKILDAGNYLLNLINDILDMSKIESGKTTLSIGKVGIREMCESLSSLLQQQTAEKHLTLTTEIENITYNYVYADELRVRQILMNILSNAVKYTPNGGKIDFHVEGITGNKKNHQKLRIKVTDTGYGIAPQALPTIFEPFTRASNTRTSKIQGTGLGLAIVKNLVDLMGGTVSAKSELGKGSCFTVELVFPSAMEEGETIEKNPLPQEEEEFSLKGMHILAAEDNDLNAEILEELLKVEGAKCQICEDGKKTLEAFENAEPGTYDLILMDVQMPVMNGYEATRAIRRSSHPEAGSMLIIAMTANAFAEDVRDALNAGMNAHVAKPLEMHTLKATIENLQKNRKRGKQE